MKQLLLTLSLSILFIPFGMSQGTTNRNSDMILPHATSVESNTSIRDTIGTLIESNSTNTDGYDKFTGFQSQVNGTSGIKFSVAKKKEGRPPKVTILVKMLLVIPIVIANIASGPNLLYFPKAMGPGYIPIRCKNCI